MALVHEQLYRSADLGQIDMKNYVGELIGNIHSIMISRGLFLSYDLDVEDLALSIEHALPIGLILNELITNTYKHGYPGKSEAGSPSGFTAKTPAWTSSFPTTAF
ncbi:MAG: hypothetical protein HC888_16165, partial [Candidatus Competibacteraceae bacterium]|nr:hypothetical protein [Candidatus Competibacteraceae bacterium]